MNMTTDANTPYIAVIFISTKEEQLEGYQEVDDEMMELAQQQDGFMSYESIQGAEKSVFISYWRDMESIDKWKQNARHIFAKQSAPQWYKYWKSQVCIVQSSREFKK